MVGRVKETTGRIGELESALQTLQLEHERLEFSLRAKTSEHSVNGPLKRVTLFADANFIYWVHACSARRCYGPQQCPAAVNHQNLDDPHNAVPDHCIRCR
jgi:hypothetical protein